MPRRRFYKMANDGGVIRPSLFGAQESDAKMYKPDDALHVLYRRVNLAVVAVEILRMDLGRHS